MVNTMELKKKFWLLDIPETSVLDTAAQGRPQGQGGGKQGDSSGNGDSSTPAPSGGNGDDGGGSDGGDDGGGGGGGGGHRTQTQKFDSTKTEIGDGFDAGDLTTPTSFGDPTAKVTIGGTVYSLSSMMNLGAGSTPIDFSSSGSGLDSLFYGTPFYTSPTQLKDPSDIADIVGQFSTQGKNETERQKFLRHQAAVQQQSQVQTARAEAERAQDLADSAARAADVAEKQMQAVGMGGVVGDVAPKPQTGYGFDIDTATDLYNWADPWASDDIIDYSGKDFWGTRDTVAMQRLPDNNLELQLQLALSNVRINTSENRIDNFEMQMNRLTTTMQTEEAKMRNTPQREGFAGYNEQFFMTESAVWRDAKHEKEQLKKILDKEKAFLEKQISKKEAWENLSLTDVTAAAFTGGVALGAGTKNPMETDTEHIRPATVDTLAYVPGDPEITDVLQAPKDKSKKPTSVFTGLELPKINYMEGFKGILPLAHAEDEPTTTPEAPTSETPATEPQQTEAQRLEAMGLAKDQAEYAAAVIAQTTGTEEQVGQSFTDMRKRITASDGTPIDNPNYGLQVQAVPTAQEYKERTAQGEVWSAYTPGDSGWAPDAYAIRTETPSEDLTYDQDHFDKMNREAPIDQGLKEQQINIETERLQMILGKEYNDETKSWEPVPLTDKQKQKIETDAEQMAKGIYFTSIEPPTTLNPETGKQEPNPLAGEQRAGYVFADTYSGDAVDKDSGVKISEIKRKQLEKAYQWQATKAEINKLQKERFDAIGSGDISIASMLKGFGQDSKQYALSKKYFTERGIPLTTPVGAISLGQDDQAKLLAGDDTRFIKDAEKFGEVGIDVQKMYGTVDPTGQDPISSVRGALQLQANLDYQRKQTSKFPEASEYLVFASAQATPDFTDSRHYTIDIMGETPYQLTDDQVGMYREGGHEVTAWEGFGAIQPMYEVTKAELPALVTKLTQAGRFGAGASIVVSPDDPTEKRVFRDDDGNPETWDNVATGNAVLFFDDLEGRGREFNTFNEQGGEGVLDGGIAGLYVQPESQVTIHKAQAGDPFYGGGGGVEIGVTKLSFEDDKEAQIVVDAFNEIKDTGKMPAEGSPAYALLLSMASQQNIGQINNVDTYKEKFPDAKIGTDGTTSINALTNWIGADRSETSGYSNIIDFEAKVISGFAPTAAFIAEQEDLGRIETVSDQKLRIAKEDRDSYDKWKALSEIQRSTFGAPTPDAVVPAVVPEVQSEGELYEFTPIPIIPIAHAEEDTPSQILVPTPADLRQGEFKVVITEPIGAIFNEGIGGDLKLTEKGKDMQARGELPNNMTFGEAVDQKIIYRDGIVDELRYLLSRDTQIFANIGRAAGMVATQDTETFRIYEPTFFEQGIDSIIQQVQFAWGTRGESPKVADPTAVAGMVDPMTGEVTQEFGEAVARPFWSHSDEKDEYGNVIPNIDPNTGKPVGTWDQMWQELSEEAAYYGSKHEKGIVVGDKSTGMLSAPEWEKEGFLGGLAAFRALPWGTLAEIPAEALFFAVALPARVSVMAALKIAPRLSSGMAAGLLSGLERKLAPATAKYTEAERQVSSFRAQGLPDQAALVAPTRFQQYAAGMTKVIQKTRPVEGFTAEGTRVGMPSTAGKFVVAEALVGKQTGLAEAVSSDLIKVTQKVAGYTPQKFESQMSKILYPDAAIKGAKTVVRSTLYTQMQKATQQLPPWLRDSRIGSKIAAVGTHELANKVEQIAKRMRADKALEEEKMTDDDISRLAEKTVVAEYLNTTGGDQHILNYIANAKFGQKSYFDLTPARKVEVDNELLRLQKENVTANIAGSREFHEVFPSKGVLPSETVEFRLPVEETYQKAATQQDKILVGGKWVSGVEGRITEVTGKGLPDIGVMGEKGMVVGEANWITGRGEQARLTGGATLPKKGMPLTEGDVFTIGGLSRSGYTGSWFGTGTDTSVLFYKAAQKDTPNILSTPTFYTGLDPQFVRPALQPRATEQYLLQEVREPWSKLTKKEQKTYFDQWLSHQPVTQGVPVSKFGRVNDSKHKKLLEKYNKSGAVVNNTGHWLEMQTTSMNSGFKIHVVAYTQKGTAELYARLEPLFQHYKVTRKYAASKVQLEQMAKKGHTQEGKAVTAYLPKKMIDDAKAGNTNELINFQADLAKALEGFTPDTTLKAKFGEVGDKIFVSSPDGKLKAVKGTWGTVTADEPLGNINFAGVRFEMTELSEKAQKAYLAGGAEQNAVYRGRVKVSAKEAKKRKYKNPDAFGNYYEEEIGGIGALPSYKTGKEYSPIPEDISFNPFAWADEKVIIKTTKSSYTPYGGMPVTEYVGGVVEDMGGVVARGGGKATTKREWVADRMEAIDVMQLQRHQQAKATALANIAKGQEGGTKKVNEDLVKAAQVEIDKISKKYKGKGSWKTTTTTDDAYGINLDGTISRDAMGEHGWTVADEFGYPYRTRANVADSDLTLIFGDITSPGSALTLRTAKEQGKHVLVNPTKAEIKNILEANPAIRDNDGKLTEGIYTINIAGSRKTTGSHINAIEKEWGGFLEDASKNMDYLSPKYRVISGGQVGADMAGSKAAAKHKGSYQPKVVKGEQITKDVIEEKTVVGAGSLFDKDGDFLYLNQFSWKNKQIKLTKKERAKQSKIFQKEYQTVRVGEQDLKRQMYQASRMIGGTPLEQKIYRLSDPEVDDLLKLTPSSPDEVRRLISPTSGQTDAGFVSKGLTPEEINLGDKLGINSFGQQVRAPTNKVLTKAQDLHAEFWRLEDSKQEILKQRAITSSAKRDKEQKLAIIDQQQREKWGDWADIFAKQGLFGKIVKGRDWMVRSYNNPREKGVHLLMYDSDKGTEAYFTIWLDKANKKQGYKVKRDTRQIGLEGIGNAQVLQMPLNTRGEVEMFVGRHNHTDYLDHKSGDTSKQNFEPKNPSNYHDGWIVQNVSASPMNQHPATSFLQKNLNLTNEKYHVVAVQQWQPSIPIGSVIGKGDLGKAGGWKTINNMNDWMDDSQIAGKLGIKVGEAFDPNFIPKTRVIIQTAKQEDISNLSDKVLMRVVNELRKQEIMRGDSVDTLNASGFKSLAAKYPDSLKPLIYSGTTITDDMTRAIAVRRVVGTSQKMRKLGYNNSTGKYITTKWLPFEKNLTKKINTVKDQKGGFDKNGKLVSHEYNPKQLLHEDIDETSKTFGKVQVSYHSNFTDGGKFVNDTNLLDEMRNLGFHFRQWKDKKGIWRHKIRWSNSEESGFVHHKGGYVFRQSKIKRTKMINVDGKSVPLTEAVARQKLKEIHLSVLEQRRDAPRAWVVDNVRAPTENLSITRRPHGIPSGTRSSLTDEQLVWVKQNEEILKEIKPWQKRGMLEYYTGGFEPQEKGFGILTANPRIKVEAGTGKIVAIEPEFAVSIKNTPASGLGVQTTRNDGDNLVSIYKHYKDEHKDYSANFDIMATGTPNDVSKAVVDEFLQPQTLKILQAVKSRLSVKQGTYDVPDEQSRILLQQQLSQNVSNLMKAEAEKISLEGLAKNIDEKIKIERAVQQDVSIGEGRVIQPLSVFGERQIVGQPTVVPKYTEFEVKRQLHDQMMTQARTRIETNRGLKAAAQKEIDKNMVEIKFTTVKGDELNPIITTEKVSTKFEKPYEWKVEYKKNKDGTHVISTKTYTVYNKNKTVSVEVKKGDAVVEKVVKKRNPAYHGNLKIADKLKKTKIGTQEYNKLLEQQGGWQKATNDFDGFVKNISKDEKQIPVDYGLSRQAGKDAEKALASSVNDGNYSASMQVTVDELRTTVRKYAFDGDGNVESYDWVVDEGLKRKRQDTATNDIAGYDWGTLQIKISEQQNARNQFGTLFGKPLPPPELLQSKSGVWVATPTSSKVSEASGDLWVDQIGELDKKVRNIVNIKGQRVDSEFQRDYPNLKFETKGNIKNFRQLTLNDKKMVLAQLGKEYEAWTGGKDVVKATITIGGKKFKELRNINRKVGEKVDRDSGVFKPSDAPEQSVSDVFDLTKSTKEGFGRGKLGEQADYYIKSYEQQKRFVPQFIEQFEPVHEVSIRTLRKGKRKKGGVWEWTSLGEHTGGGAEGVKKIIEAAARKGVTLSMSDVYDATVRTMPKVSTGRKGKDGKMIMKVQEDWSRKIKKELVPRKGQIGGEVRVLDIENSLFAVATKKTTDPTFVNMDKWGLAPPNVRTPFVNQPANIASGMANDIKRQMLAGSWKFDPMLSGLEGMAQRRAAAEALGQPRLGATSEEVAKAARRINLVTEEDITLAKQADIDALYIKLEKENFSNDGSLANLLQKRQVNEKRRQTLINKAKEVQKDELGTDGQYWRRRLLDAEAKKDEAFAAQKKTTMPPGTGDTEFEGVFYNSPNWKKIKKAQNDIMHVKKEMEKRGYTVPNYSLDVQAYWAAHEAIAAGKSATRKVPRDLDTLGYTQNQKDKFMDDIKDKNVNDYFKPQMENLKAQDEKIIAKQKIGEEKKEVINTAMSSPDMKEARGGLYSFKPTSEKVRESIVKKLEKTNEKVQKLNEESLQLRKLHEADEAKRQKAEDDDLFFPQRTSYAGTTEEVRLDDLLADTGNLHDFFLGETMTKQKLGASGYQTKVVDWYVHDTYGTTYFPIEGVQSKMANWLTRGAVLSEPIRLGKGTPRIDKKTGKPLLDHDGNVIRDFNAEVEPQRFYNMVKTGEVVREPSEEMLIKAIKMIYFKRLPQTASGRHVETVTGGFKTQIKKIKGEQYQYWDKDGNLKTRSAPEQRFSTGMAGDVNVRDYHVRAVEKELGITLEGQGDKIVQLLKGGAIKGKGVIKSSADWEDTTYDLWHLAVTKRSFADRAQKFILNRQIIKNDGKMLVMPQGFVFKRTPAGKFLGKMEDIKVKISQLRAKRGERPTLESEDAPVLNTIQKMLTQQKVSEHSLNTFTKSKKSAKESLFKYIDLNYSTAITTKKRRLSILQNKQERLKEQGSGYTIVKTGFIKDGKAFKKGDRIYSAEYKRLRALLQKLEKAPKKNKERIKKLEVKMKNMRAHKLTVNKVNEQKKNVLEINNLSDEILAIATKKANVKAELNQAYVNAEITQKEYLKESVREGKVTHLRKTVTRETTPEDELKTQFQMADGKEFSDDFMAQHKTKMEETGAVMQDDPNIITSEQILKLKKKYHDARTNVKNVENKYLDEDITGLDMFKLIEDKQAKTNWLNMMKRERTKAHKIKDERNQSFMDHNLANEKLNKLSMKLQRQKYRNPDHYSNFMLQEGQLIRSDPVLGQHFSDLITSGKIEKKQDYVKWLKKQRRDEEAEWKKTERQLVETEEKKIQGTKGTQETVQAKKEYADIVTETGAKERLAHQKRTAEQDYRNSMADGAAVNYPTSGIYDPFLLAKYPAAAIVPFRVSGTDAVQQQNWDITQPLPTTFSVEHPTTPKTTSPQVSQVEGMPDTPFNPFGYDMVVPPPMAKLDPNQPLPNLIQNVRMSMDGIQTNLQTPKIGQFMGQTQGLSLAQGQASMQGFSAKLDAGVRQDYMQKMAPPRTVAITTPTVRVQTPRKTPPPTIPAYVFPPWETKRPRRKLKKKVKKKKTSIWWDVPTQPLGEAWNPQEYIVFKGKQEPQRVKRKERRKKLDWEEGSTTTESDFQSDSSWGTGQFTP
tara:strand:+ start:592 stop:17298 length:16707 start_codon:yes stop_codon:yes gene_type:complete